MKQYVLDSSSIVRNPQILSRTDKTVRFIVPSGVLLGLSRGEEIPSLVDSAVGLGAAIIEDTSGTGEQAVIEVARKLQANGEDVAIVSEDRDIHAAARHLGIEVKDVSECLSELQDVPVNQELAQDARKATKVESLRSLVQALAGVILSLLAQFAPESLSAIAESFNVWGTLLLIFVAGIFLYWLRARFRLTYAVLELIVGFGTAASVFYPNFDYKSLDTNALVRLLGGLYVMVRGQDNLSKALEGTRFEASWKRFSGESVGQTTSRPTRGLKRTATPRA